MSRVRWNPFTSGRAVGLIFCALAIVSILAAPEQRTDASAPTRFPGPALEASGVVALPGTESVLIVADGDDHDVFWMEFDGNGVGQVVVPVPIGAKVPDPEDITFDGTHVYVVGSQSRGAKNADGLVRFRFDPAAKSAGPVERVPSLQGLFEARSPELAKLDRGRTGPLNIEGLAWDASRKRLLFGLRSPMRGRNALIVAARLTNPAQPLSAANLTVEPELIALDLGGLAIRGMGFDRMSNRHLIIAGGSTDEAKGTFRLFEWDGTSASVRDMGAIRSAEKPEGITRLPIGGRMRSVIVFDLGGYQVIN